MMLYSSETLVVEVPADKDWVCVVCTAACNYSSFKAGMLEALAYVKQHGIDSWLLDFRCIDHLGEEEETWLQVQLFPQLIMLGHEHYFAVVVSEKCYNNLLQEVGAYGLRSYNSFIIINTFLRSMRQKSGCGCNG